jgi:hypothetical protein
LLVMGSGSGAEWKHQRRGREAMWRRREMNLSDGREVMRRQREQREVNPVRGALHASEWARSEWTWTVGPELNGLDKKKG